MTIFYRMKAALVAALALASTLTATVAWAETYEEEAGRSGPFLIHKVYENGSFHRCIATLKPGKNALRIAWTIDHTYVVSVPGVRKSNSVTMDFIGMETFSFPAKSNGTRAWAVWDDPGVQALLNTTESINIAVDGRDFSWNIGNTSMVDVLAAVEDCVHASSAGAVQQDQSADDSDSGRTNGFSVKKVFFDGGAYVRGNNGKWTERGDDGDVTFRFVEVDSTEDEVFLEDRSRGVKITLNLADSMIYYSDRKQKRRPLYPITDWK